MLDSFDATTGAWSASLAAGTLADGTRYTISVQATHGGLTASTSGRLEVDTSIAQPTVSLASDTGASAIDGITKAAQVNVEGLETDALWQYSLDAGAHWTSGSGSRFELPGDGDAIVVVRQADLAGNIAFSHPILARLDTVRPTISLSSNKAALLAGESATITLSLSEAAQDFSLEDIQVTGGTLSNLVGITGASLGGMIDIDGFYMATFTPDADFRGTANITVVGGRFHDLAGNPNLGGSDLNGISLAIDTLRPTVAVASDRTLLKAGDSALIEFVFSEAPGTSFTESDVSVSGGTLSNFAGSGTRYTATFTPGAGVTAGSVAVTSGAFRSASGNLNLDGADADNGVGLLIDTVAPTLAITSDASALRLGETARIRFTFSEVPGTPFGLEDVVVTGGTLNEFAGSDKHYTAIFTPSAGQAAGTASLTVAAGGYTDAAGNAGAAATLSDMVLDTLAPTLTISSEEAVLKVGQATTIHFDFSEAPGASFSAADLLASGGTLTGFAGSGTHYTAIFTPLSGVASGSAEIGVVAGSYLDAAGNRGSAAQLSLSIDTEAPRSLGLKPADDTNVLPGGRLVLEFDEEIARGSGDVRLLDDTTGTSVMLGVSELLIQGRVLTIDPATDLVASHHYHVEIDTGALTDLAGNPWAGIANATDWNFVASTPAVSLDMIAADNRVNTDENDAAIAIGGSVSSNDPALLAAFTSTDFTVVLTPRGGGSAVVATVEHYDSSSGAWRGNIAANTLEDGLRYDVSVTVSRIIGGVPVSVATHGELLADLGTPAALSAQLARDTGFAGDGESANGLLQIGGLESDATWAYSLDNGLQWQPGTGDSVLLSGDGAKHVLVRQIDAAGNLGDIGPALDFTLDTTAPAAPQLTLDADTGLAGDALTAEGTVGVSGLETGASWQYRLDGAAWHDGSGERLTVAGDGAHTLQVAQVDRAGNLSAATTLAFTLDTAAATPDAQLTGATDDGGAILAPSNLEAGALLEYRLQKDGGAFSAWSEGYTAPPDDGSANGRYVLEIRQTDLAGNVSASRSLAFELNAAVSTTVELSAVEAGFGGFVINGHTLNDVSGWSVSGAGDVNGDGLDDLVVGAFNNEFFGAVLSGFTSTGSGNDETATPQFSPGHSYVVFGKSDGSAVDLAAVAAGSGGGFAINGEAAWDFSGFSVATAGDLNGDGLDDLIVGAPLIMGDGKGILDVFQGGLDAEMVSMLVQIGRSYVVYGKNEGAAVDLSTVAHGSGGFTIDSGGELFSLSGMKVAAAGDVNGDGFADLLVGAPIWGATYVVFGQSNGATVELSSIAAGAGGFKISDGQLLSGFGAGAAGDVNGDGLGDVIVGAGLAGVSYVVFGRTGGELVDLSPALVPGADLPAIVASVGGLMIVGKSGSGWSVSGAGDVNGDGLADLIIGAPASADSLPTLLTGSPDASGGDVGHSYVVFGRSGSGLVNLEEMAVSGNGGFAIDGQLPNGISGFSVSGAGDMNGDGLADLIVGAPANMGTATGHSYVVFGRSGGTAVQLSDVAQGVGGFDIVGATSGDWSGWSVAAAGDVNGDGLADLIIGAPHGTTVGGTDAGRSYVVFGATNGAFTRTAVDTLGSDGADLLGDGGIARSLVGGAGDDTLTASAASVLYGGAGRDTFVIDGAMIEALGAPLGQGGNLERLARIDGGSDIDTILLAGTGLSLELERIANQGASQPVGGSRIANIERIDLGTSGTNVLSLAAGDVADMAGFNTFNDGNGWTGLGLSVPRHQLVIDGSAGGVVNGSGQWFDLGTLVQGGHTYQIYERGSVQVLADLALTRNFPLAPAVRTSVELLEIAAGLGGFAIDGQLAGDASGVSVASAGDVNGDGLDDLLIGAATASGSAGRSYVVFGSTDGRSAELSEIALGIGGFAIEGQATGDASGASLSAAGDLNGDGLADILVGAKGANAAAGRSYVVYGKTDTAAVALSALVAGQGGFAIEGQAAGDASGWSVSAAGDVNGDGLADLILGATGVNGGAGRSYVVFGRSDNGPIDLSAIASGTGGFAINGQSAGDASGWSVTSAGDVNGDGFADLVVGAKGANGGAGHSYVVFGRSSGTPVSLSALGARGFAIEGESAGDASGGSVAGVGDVNGDGLADLLIGAQGANGGAGRSYIVFGKSGGATVALSALAQGTGGFAINGQCAADGSGASVAGIGDINGDGLADFVIGAAGADPTTGNAAGRSYVVFGKTDTRAVDLSAVALASGGFAINGEGAGDGSGAAVSGAGDVNGDGLADLIVGAKDANGGAGRSYVIFGATDGVFASTRIALLGSAGNDVLADGGLARSLAGGAGDDMLVATAASVLYGGAGDDRFIVDSAMLAALKSPLGSAERFARIDGGSGVDTIALAGAGLVFELGRIAAQAGGDAEGGSRIDSIECIDFSGSGNNSLNLSAAAVADMAGFNTFNDSTGWVGLGASVPRHQLIVRGDSGDVLTLTGAWGRSGQIMADGHTYQIYEGERAAQVLVDLQVRVAPTVVELSAIAGGTGGFALNGMAANDYSGWSVSSAGDVNGDGLADLLIGAKWSDAGTLSNVGRSYLVFGRTATSPVTLSALGTSGFAINGRAAGDASGWSVSAAGDVNGDGLADLIVGAPYVTPTAGSGAGRSYVVFGRNASTAIDLSAIADGSGGFAINGQNAGDASGWSVGGAGDVNGDGLADLIVGAYKSSPLQGSDRAGRSYVVFGKAGGTAVDLSAVAAGHGGFAINGQSWSDWSGYSVSGAGDVNGDGLADLIVGAPQDDSTTKSEIVRTAGRSYVVFGRTGGTAINLSALGTNGFVIKGVCTGERNGFSVAGAGDVNGDGLADLIVGAPGANGGVGRSYVVFGRSSNAAVELSALGRGTDGFVINGQSVNDASGSSVSGAGDVNGDGLADLIIGAKGANGGAGRSYVVFGRSAGTAVDLSAIAEGSGGFAINGQSAGDGSGGSVSGAGDLNGDGLADLIVGASAGDPAGSSDAGRSYVIFGATTGAFMNTRVDRLGGSGNDVLADGGSSRTLVGGAGDDTLSASAASVLYGGAGNDRFVIDGTMLAALQAPLGSAGNLERLARIDGGGGLDTIALAGSNLVLDLGSIADQAAGDPNGGSRISGIERIDLIGSGNNALSVSAADVIAMAGVNVFNDGNGWTGLGASVQRHQLLVESDSSDVLTLTGAWGKHGQITASGHTYQVYESGSAAQLLVDVRVRLTPAVVELSAIASGTGGFTIGGQSAGDQSGYSVSAAGDVNGDGLADLIVGAPGANGSAGRSYVVFGKSGSAAVSLSALGAGGFAINGHSAGDASGWSVSAAGDVNGDGLADLVVGAPYANPVGGADAGRSYVVFGKTGSTAVSLSALSGDGFTINGQSASDDSGWSVSAAGDVNGDGLADLIVGTPFSNPAGGTDAGRSYVVFGKAGTTAVSLASLGSGGFTINGQTAGDLSGWSVSGIGDMNGDGLSDLVVGAREANGRAGRSYVVFGKAGSTAVSLSALGAGGFVINGQSSNDESGWQVAGAGDVNGDGLADLIIGVPQGDPVDGSNAGRSYVVFGRGGTTAVELSAVAAGTGGFVINGLCTGDLSGYSVAGAGDINGDGLADLIIGAPGTDLTGASDAGRSYVVFGKNTTGVVSLSDVATGRGGFAIDGQAPGDASGWSVSGAGDVNGDGLADLLVGAPQTQPGAGSDAGHSYVIFGATTGAFMDSRVDQLGGSGADVMSDSGTPRTLVGGAGNDTLSATAASVLYGGSGSDVFVIGQAMATALKTPYGSPGNNGPLNARIDGGDGGVNADPATTVITELDTIQLSGSNVVLDLQAISNVGRQIPGIGSRVSGIEAIDLGSGTGNKVVLTMQDVLDVTDGVDTIETGWSLRHNLIIKGTQGTVDLAEGATTTTGIDTSGWSHEMALFSPKLYTSDGARYECWFINDMSAGQVVVLVQQGLTVI